MAAIIRYVDVNSAAGGDGTTDATAGANRAYSSQNEMEAAEQADLVSAGDTFTGICAGGIDSTVVVYSGWTTGASNDILITTTTDRHVGVFDAAKYNLDTGTAVNTALTISEEFISIVGLQFNRGSAPVSSLDRISVNIMSVVVGVCNISKNIFKSSAFDITGDVVAISINDSDIDYQVSNNVIYDFSGTDDFGVRTPASSPTGDIYNNTFVNCTTGAASKAGLLFKNNVFQDCAADISGAVNGSNDYNLTDNVSIPGANSVANSTLVFENKAVDNFALVVGDTDAIGAGIGPSADANVPLSDIIGTARSGATTDIGAFVFVGGGGVTVTATLGAIDYTSQNATVALTGSVDIATTVGTISYSSQNTTVSLTGDIDVTATLGSINYSSQNATVSVTGDIDVIATLGAIDYSSNNTTVTLASETIVNATLGTIDYTSQNTTVVLSGLVEVTATLGSIVYNSYPVTVQIGEGQTIENVTAGFADDIYTAGFKPDTITVSFK